MQVLGPTQAMREVAFARFRRSFQNKLSTGRSTHSSELLLQWSGVEEELAAEADQTLVGLAGKIGAEASGVAQESPNNCHRHPFRASWGSSAYETSLI